MREYELERRLIAAALLICAILVGITAFSANRLREPEIYVVLSSQEIPGNQDLPTEPICINTCTKEQLLSLPGIGETLAQRILDDRMKNGAFRSVEDLCRVSGIGESKLAAIREYIVIE